MKLQKPSLIFRLPTKGKSSLKDGLLFFFIKKASLVHMVILAFLTECKGLNYRSLSSKIRSGLKICIC